MVDLCTRTFFLHFSSFFYSSYPSSFVLKLLREHRLLGDPWQRYDWRRIYSGGNRRKEGRRETGRTGGRKEREEQGEQEGRKENRENKRGVELGEKERRRRTRKAGVGGEKKKKRRKEGEEHREQESRR